MMPFFTKGLWCETPHNILLELCPFTKVQRYTQTIKEMKIILVQD
jgi:cystathionine beta-lyase/cystathionine gamma-synthase